MAPDDALIQLLVRQVLEERLLQAGLLLQGMDTQHRPQQKQLQNVRSSVRTSADSDEDSDFD